MPRTGLTVIQLSTEALIFDIKRDCSEDGPGIRTTVFFKGCPLSCSWCQNPEGRTATGDLSFRAEACEPGACGAPCEDVCPVPCLHMGATPRVDFSACVRCDRCFAVCPTACLEPVGYRISLEDLLYRVSIDRPFYRSTGGGVTLSGGEATQQIGFLQPFLQELKRDGIHTALETCGFFNLDAFRKRILPWLDLIYFDLKVMDEAQSRRYTGRSNRRVLENFTFLVREAGVAVIPRIALIPGITATRKNLQQLARFMAGLGVETCTLIPYNPLWRGKLKRLGLDSQYTRDTFLTPAEEATWVRCFQDAFTKAASSSSETQPARWADMGRGV